METSSGAFIVLMGFVLLYVVLDYVFDRPAPKQHHTRKTYSGYIRNSKNKFHD